MKNAVFNNLIFGSNISNPTIDEEQAKKIEAALFEQLLIFDSITISTNRLNFGLAFLINRFGINNVEKLFEKGMIKIMIWSPVILTSTGTTREDNSFDESSIYGQPPIGAGTLTGDDLDPEKNIDIALNHFPIDRERKRIFKRIAVKSYIVPNGMAYSSNSERLILEAYQNNTLADIGLPFEREPTQLHANERQLLLQLGNKVLETAVISEYNLKSYENYEHYSICKKNAENIGNAFNIAENTSNLFRLENLPNLKELYLQERLNIESVFKMRYLSNAKYYRNWINTVGENSNAEEITAEYLNQIKGNTKFFESSEGKFVKTLGLFGISAAVGSAIAGPLGGAVGLGLSFAESFWLDKILKGKTPSMFIDDVKKELRQDNY